MARVLVVDDEPVQVDTIRYNFRREGYDIQVANDGNEALKLAQAASPDLVVLDLMLPGLDGLEVCRQRLRSARPTDESRLVRRRLKCHPERSERPPMPDRLRREVARRTRMTGESPEPLSRPRGRGTSGTPAGETLTEALPGTART